MKPEKSPEADSSYIIKKCQDWLRGNIVYNLLNAGFQMSYLSSPQIEKRGYWMCHCSVMEDIGKDRVHYLFMINKDGSWKKIGRGSFDEETNTLTVKEVKIEWIE